MADLTAMMQAAAGNAGGGLNVQEVFSTTLYTGNGSTQTINNGIDLAGEGGLVWIKKRSSTIANTGHILEDTARGANKFLSTNSVNAESFEPQNFTFNSNGFGFNVNNLTMNFSPEPYVSWTFRKQPKFFDVVTYTGTGANRTVAHSLGSVPGSIWVKRTDDTANWQCYHRTLANTQYMELNSTAAAATGATRWNSTTPTDAVFSLGTDATVNASGGTYVAYVYAHDAGGFGLTDEDNVISCESYTGNGAANGPTITLGYEPQWVMIKRSQAPSGSGTAGWVISDSMRGLSPTTDGVLSADTSGAESVGTFVQATATGFKINTTNPNWNISGDTYIYIAIRRGPI